MARGDYYIVIYRTGVGTASHMVRARRVGGSVSYDEPREKDLFVEVAEKNKAGEAVQTARFAKGDVVAILEGNAPEGEGKEPQPKRKNPTAPSS